MKNLDWGKLTDDLLEAMVTNQHHLAKICHVTQQSVSNWKTGTRSPGVYARNQLRELATEHSLDINSYKKSNINFENSSSLNLNENILSLAIKLSQLPSHQQSKILEMTEFLIAKS